jgi:hypothetical protein
MYGSTLFGQAPTLQPEKKPIFATQLQEEVRWRQMIKAFELYHM